MNFCTLDKTKWLIVILAMLGVALVIYMGCATNVWGFGTFLCQLLAVIELAYGIWIATTAQRRKKSYRLSPEERHAYVQYLYDKRYRRYPAAANQMLFVMVRMDLILGHYERAAKELADIHIDKCIPAQLKLYYYLKVITSVMAEDETGLQESRICYEGIPDVKGVYPSEPEFCCMIEQRDIVRMLEALNKAALDKKMHPIRISIITVILSYSTFFYGLWYGINRDIGYEVRYHFAEISIAVIVIGLAVIVIWGIVSLYRHSLLELSIQSGKSRVASIVVYGAAAIFALVVLGMSGLSVVLGMNGTETVTGHDSKYVYIMIQDDYGNNRRYRTDNLFVMQSMDSLRSFSDTADMEENSEVSMDEAEDYDAEGQRDGSMLQNEMMTVYNYLQKRNILQDMSFSYTANARGDVYAVVSETQEEKDGNMVNVRYCLYDNGSKTDANGNICQELVLEKIYPDGNYETELVNFYLVNVDTMQVTDEQRSMW